MGKIGENSNDKDWTVPSADGTINVPDELMPLFNRIGFQFRLHTISGQNEILCVARCVKSAKEFFEGGKSFVDKTSYPSCFLSRNPARCCIYSIGGGGCDLCGHKREVKEVENKVEKQLNLF